MSYRLLTLLLWPALFLYTLKIAWRDRSMRYLLQRLGFSYNKIKSQVWIHCASVGEVNTYIHLHKKLIEQHPATRFLITTNTTTGAQTVKQHQLLHTQHCYLPIESGFAIKRFLNAVQPEQCLIMETEIWPLLYSLCAKRNIPLSIINARLSHRTLNANRWITSLYKRSLQKVAHILCKSVEEQQHYQQLGASKAQLEIAGNLKFAAATASHTATPIELNQRRYWLAASTHHNEEQQLAIMWKQLNNNELLVIVPRHPNRSAKIQKQLNELNINYAVRSKQQNVSNATQIYLADTLGELTGFIAAAYCVFIGGSLIKHGGQNILEPASAGKAILCGPHMYNFTEELELLKSAEACLQVSNITELKNACKALLENPQKINSLAQNSLKVMQRQSDVLNNYLTLIKIK